MHLFLNFIFLCLPITSLARSVPNENSSSRPKYAKLQDFKLSVKNEKLDNELKYVMESSSIEGVLQRLQKFKDILSEITKDRSLDRKDGGVEISSNTFDLLKKHTEIKESRLDSLTRLKRSETKNTSHIDELDLLKQMDDDDLLRTEFQDRINNSKGQGSGDDAVMGTTSDYVLIAMIVAMMFCMTLCCLCLFFRSSSRLSICGINFELNDRRNSLNAEEDLSEIHEVVPLTPTTADNNRLPDIESILRADAPPPKYNEIVKKNSKRKTAVSLQDEKKIPMSTIPEQGAKENEGKVEAKRSKKNSRISTQTSVDRGSETSSLRSNGGRSSWRIPGRGIIASFRSKSAMLRHRKSDSALARTTIDESLPPLSSHSSDTTLTPTRRFQGVEAGEVIAMETLDEVVKRDSVAEDNENANAVTMETVNEVNTETEKERKAKQDKVFVYDVSDLPDDDDVFL